MRIVATEIVTGIVIGIATGCEDERFERDAATTAEAVSVREISELRKLQRVDLFLKSSEEIRNVRFIDFDDDTCCANFTKCQRRT